MAESVMSVSNVIHMLDFLSDVCVLYEVEQGLEFRLVAANSKAQLSGATPRSFYGMRMSEFLPPTFYHDTLLPILREVVETKQPYQGQWVSPYTDVNHTVDCFVTPIVHEDTCTHIWIVAKQQRTAEDLEYLSSTDSLTGVYNRRFFFECLHKSFKRHVEQGIEFAIMLIDLDNFKGVNDTNGHPFGDKLLRILSRRITSCIRDNDIVGRLGGDEFIVLSEGFEALNRACKIAQRILGKLQEPFQIGGSHSFVTASIGIAMAHGHEDIESVISDADHAMYRAKFSGGNLYLVHDTIVGSTVNQTNSMEQ